MKRLKRIREEIANTASGANIAGLPPDTPPVRKRPPILRRKQLVLPKK